MSHTPEPGYAVVKSDHCYQIRLYDPAVVADVTVPGQRKDAIRNGFRILADYIFGDNIAAEKIPMTAPVTQSPIEAALPISGSMMVPVMQTGGTGGWLIRFFMPPGSRVGLLPKPRSDLIELHDMPARREAIIKFRGRADDRKLENRTEELLAWMRDQNLVPKSEPVFAFYNPPWTPGFLRRNEVMIGV